MCHVILTSECCAQILQWNPDSCTLMLQYRVPLPVYDSSPDSALIVLPLPHCPTGVPPPSALSMSWEYAMYPYFYALQDGPKI